MEFLNLNLTEVPNDTINNLSEISFSSEITNKGSLSGGFFWSDDGSTKVDKSIIEAARLKKYDTVEFMINQDLMTNYKTQDENGNTLLHYLVMNSNPNSNLIEKILQRPNVNSFINIQNKEGDTPLILAVSAGHHDLCTKLIEKGADKQKRNNKGLRVDTETEIEEPNASEVSIHTVESIGSIGPMGSSFELDDHLRKIMLPLEVLLLRKNANRDRFPQTSEPTILKDVEDIKTEDLSDNQTSEFVQNLQQRYNSSNLTKSDTEETLGKIETFLENSKSQKGGNCGCGISNETDNLIKSIEKYFNQSGGAKSKSKSQKVKGKRKIKKYYEGNLDIDEENIENPERGSELNRILNNQTTEVINGALSKIQEIIIENKQDFKNIEPSKETAKAYKAALWSMVKEKNPDLKMPLDIAIEMEKMISKKVLMEIDVDEWIKKLKAHYEEKDKKKKMETSETDTISSTSSEEVSPESNLSETSMTIN